MWSEGGMRFVAQSSSEQFPALTATGAPNGGAVLLRANCRYLKPTSGQYAIELVEGLKVENVEVGVLTERDRQAPRGNSPQR